jgi:hypothetical protein
MVDGLKKVFDDIHYRFEFLPVRLVARAEGCCCGGQHKSRPAVPSLASANANAKEVLVLKSAAGTEQWL